MPVYFRIKIIIPFAASLASTDFKETLRRKLDELLSIPMVELEGERFIENSKEDHGYEAVVRVPKEFDFIAQHVCWEAIAGGWTTTLYSN